MLYIALSPSFCYNLASVEIILMLDAVDSLACTNTVGIYVSWVVLPTAL